MSRVDCSNTLNYSKEIKRMCESCENCNICPMNNKGLNFDCLSSTLITQERIDIVQKWSDEHQKKTNKDVFEEFRKSSGLKEQALCSKGCPYCIADEGCKGCKEYWDSPAKGENIQ